jgi:hypothetical protein
MNQNIIWLNTNLYSINEIILFGIGAVLWIVAYLTIAKNIIKFQFVEMPMVALAGNFTWEFLRSWCFPPNMGLLIDIGYKIWFFLDIFIVISFYRFGYKQLNKSLSPYSKQFFTYGLIFWFVSLYFFKKQGLDDGIGAISAYILNVIMSVVYVLDFISSENKMKYSRIVAWTKWLGTGFISIMCAMHWATNYWLISMCIICFLVDLYYTYLIYFQKYTSATDQKPTNNSN